jgi:hypothetical protein
MTFCGPWLEAGAVTRCDNTSADMPRAIEVASHLMYTATGRQWPGLCTDTIRPCAAGAGGQMLDYPPSVGGARAVGWRACGCAGDVVSCGCTVHDAIPLPGQPVSQVLAVMVDGVALDVTPGTGDVRIVSRHGRDVLVRSDGRSWPCCQNLALPATEPGTFQVGYSYGVLPPPPGVLAAEVMACELVAGWCGGECRLPQRLTQITYEGATVAALDPFAFIEQGRFGIVEIDYVIGTYNPNRLQRTGRVLTAREYQRAASRVR